MTEVRWDPVGAAAFYDEYGEREWTRFEDGRTPSVSIATHAHYLRRFVGDGDRVLDVGCGPGRFTIELAHLGARVVAADLSPRQLELHRRYVAEAGAEDAVEARVVADVVALPFGDDEFDATVSYGGALSYVLDRAPDATAELIRVTRPGGHVLVSAMSLVGSTCRSIEGVLIEARGYGIETIDRIVATGMLPSAHSGHPAMKLYRWRELRDLLARHGEVVAVSATGIFGTDPEEPELRALLERLELDLGAEPGAIESGPHILAVVRV
jgi:ubiquinone/menaquinone biosynthesis C-methylase UbiE